MGTHTVLSWHLSSNPTYPLSTPTPYLRVGPAKQKLTDWIRGSGLDHRLQKALSGFNCPSIVLPWNSTTLKKKTQLRQKQAADLAALLFK